MRATLFRMAATTVLAGCAVIGQGQSQTITFESVPGATPLEGLVISNQFLATHGVSFRFTDGSYPRLAEIGSPVTAFYGPPNSTTHDVPATGQQVGQFFLTDDGAVGAIPPPLIATYQSPVSEASGALVDIDGTEVWTVTARDAATNDISELTLAAGDPGTGDGIATTWAFDVPSSNIYSIAFTADADLSGGALFGLAFDNFSPASSSPPSEIELGIMTAVELWWNSVSGLYYQVQYTTDPATTNWVNLGTPVQATAEITYYLDSTRGFATKDYRVIPGD